MSINNRSFLSPRKEINANAETFVSTNIMNVHTFSERQLLSIEKKCIQLMKENIQGVTSFHELFTTKNPGMLWWFSCFWIAYHGVYNNAMEYAYKLGFNYNHKRVAHGNDNLQTVFAEEILPITINYMKKLYIAPSKNNKNNANYQENVDKFCVVMENFLLEGVGVGYHFMDLTGDVNENSAERFVTNSVRSSIPLQIAYSSKSMVPFHERTTPTQQPKRMGGKRSSKS